MDTARNEPVKAALWMLGAITSFMLMAIAGRALSATHDTFEIMFFRSVIGFGLVLALGAGFGRLGEVSTRHLGIHALRNLCHFTGQNLWFFALPLIPLAQLFALEFTTPLWVTLLAPLILGERLTRTRLLAAGLGFTGVLVVAQPDVSGLSIGVLTAALSALGFAGSALFTKRLTRSETILCILFWLTLMQAVFGLVATLHDGTVTWPTAQTLPWLTVVAICGLVAHFCLTTALSVAPAVIVMPFDFLRLPLIGIVGFFLYGEAVGIALILGAGLIIGANAINLWVERPKKASDAAL
ncbi:DMT family transporter [Dinoroseobacter sp. S124A]|uniref:DMT family transporter n=1 Tax=Dinoroseobacter sp. S124A TaxID=3415128 RepID=UPI003C7E8F82